MKTICIKIGGSTIDTDGLLSALGKSLRRIINAEDFPILVHGGGKDIGRHLKLLKKEFTFIEGMRVTDTETMAAVQMVLSGDVNKRIVSTLLTENVQALGLSGVDGNLFEAEKLLVLGQDIGHVGTIRNVNTQVIAMCKQAGMIPVISPVSRDMTGAFYNVNADLAASELAIALQADHLIFISDVPGVLIDNQVKQEIRITDVEELITSGQVTGGMIPKIRSAAEAVARGVGRVHICGSIERLIEELNVDTSHGTVIY
jgi:acetylglutamate kinase